MQASKRLPFSFATRLDSSVDKFNLTSRTKKTTVQNDTLIALMRRASETRKDRTCPWRLLPISWVRPTSNSRTLRVSAKSLYSCSPSHIGQLRDRSFAICPQISFEVFFLKYFNSR